MLAHHFPPMGGSGASRALAFARYLPMYGWRPNVVTPGVDWAMNRDDGLLAQLPRDLRVVRTRSFEARPTPGGARATAVVARRSNRLRHQLGHARRFPDAHVGWLPYALAAARLERFDVLYSSSGPFTSHVAGLLLKRALRKPWVAELRDGWYRWNRAIFPDYPAWRDALERRLEAAAVRTADRVVLVTDRMAAAFAAQYPECGPAHFSVVPNGFDPSQFAGARSCQARQGFTVVHTGALYYGRSLADFLCAASRLVESDMDFARDFRLRLLGTLDAGAQLEVQRSNLGPHLEVLGQKSHDDAVQAMGEADVFLLVANTTPGAEATVPGKLFEYLAVGRPVLAIAPPESSTADVLHETGGGWLAPSGQVDAITCELKRAYHERSKRVDPVKVARFDRRRLTSELARVLDEVSGDAARRL